MSKIPRLLARIERICAWLMVPFIVAYFVTGFSLLSWFGVHLLVDKASALWLHDFMTLPFLALVSVHVGTRAYRSLPRRRKPA
jgi:hypothetical protein